MKQHTTLTIIEKETTHYTNNNCKRINTPQLQELKMKQHITLTIIENETTHYTNNN